MGHYTRQYTHLSYDIRKLIAFKFNVERKSLRKIAEELNTSPNTISQEVKSKTRASRKHIGDIKFNGYPLVLIDKAFIYEAIYQYVYKHLENNWWQYLLKGRKYRKKQTKRKKAMFRDSKSIHERGIEANERLEIGHFEADSVIGQSGGSKRVINTLVDRKSRKLFAGLANSKTAQDTLKAMLESLRPVGMFVKTITYDNGSEFVEHYKLMEELEVVSYFADPYSSWQRGTNERHNGLLRRYFPKGKNFEEIEDWELQEVVDFWNNYPRKVLGYRTPNEVWNEEVAKAVGLKRGV